VSEEIDAGDLAQELEICLRVVAQKADHLDQVLTPDGDDLVAAVAVGGHDGFRELLPHQIDQGLRHRYFPRSLPRQLRFFSRRRRAATSSCTSGATSCSWRGGAGSGSCPGGDRKSTRLNSSHG